MLKSKNGLLDRSPFFYNGGNDFFRQPEKEINTVKTPTKRRATEPKMQHYNMMMITMNVLQFIKTMCNQVANGLTVVFFKYEYESMNEIQGAF